MSAKNLDTIGRLRSKTIAFRMSPEENEQLNKKANLSGLTKQDYIIKRLLCNDIIVHGNPRVYKALRNQLEDVLNELIRIKNNNIDDELLGTIQLINVTLYGLKGEKNEHKKRNDHSKHIC